MNWFELSVKVGADESVPVSSTTIYLPRKAVKITSHTANLKWYFLLKKYDKEL